MNRIIKARAAIAPETIARASESAIARFRQCIAVNHVSLRAFAKLNSKFASLTFLSKSIYNITRNIFL